MYTERRPLLSIVIPVLNEEESIPSLLERLDALAQSLDEARLEVIFVDDHSTDGTQALLSEACSRRTGMCYYRLARNSGSHIAIYAGLARAQGACSAFLAADLQDPPELLVEMLRLWREGHHIVWAVRAVREGISFFDRATANVFYWLMNHFSAVSFPPTGSDFALLDRRVVDALLASVGATPSLVGEIARLGFRQTEVTYVKEARRRGRSKWKPSMKFRAFVDSVVAFSYVPMRIMTYVGFGVSTLALLYAVLVIILRLATEQPIEGWASTMIVLLGLGGMQMVMLGALGEYLWRNLEESRKRPSYFIEAEVGSLQLTATEEP